MEEVDGLSYASRPVRIFFDIENTPTPEFRAEKKKEVKLSDICQNITQSVRAAGMFGSIEIYSYAKEKSVLDKFKTIPGVKFNMVDDGTGNIQYTVLKYMLCCVILLLLFHFNGVYF
jgi:hypothetical protein